MPFFVFRSGTTRPANQSSSPYRKTFLFLFFMFLTLLIARGQPALLLLLIPIAFIWLTFSAFKFVLRTFAHGARRVEEFWDEHLGNDELFNKEAESEIREVAVQQPPAAVTRNARLSKIWDRTTHLQAESELRQHSKGVFRQVHALAELYERFQQLLATKLSPDELTHKRFLSSGEQSFELISNELENALGRLEQLSSESDLLPTADDLDFENSTFAKIRQEQLLKVDLLLSQTREAIGQMARVNLAISDMKRPTAAKKGDINQAVDQLKDLAQRAEKF